MTTHTTTNRELTRRIPAPQDERDESSGLTLRREWLVTNGLGGYASGTVAGVVTRRYHALLVAGLPAPFGRFVMLNHLLERVRLSDRRVLWLGDEDEVAGTNAADRPDHLVEFRLEFGLPVWVYRLGDVEVEKRVLMPFAQNTVHVTYRLRRGIGPVRLALRPSIQFRPHEAPVDEAPARAYKLSSDQNCYELSGGEDLPVLRMMLRGSRAALTLDERGVAAVPYEMEKSRGYQDVGSLWSPGYFRADLVPEEPITLVGSTEAWDTIQAMNPDEATRSERERRERLLSIAGQTADTDFAAELVLAADQFIITPAGRADEAARARAAGEEVRTVIAGYHWFNDWGRDTMISLDGLTLQTGRYREAAFILRTFAHYVRDGLIPNMFPDGSRDGLYHTADASLWFFHAINRYVRTTDDRETLRVLLPTLFDIVEHHLGGTRFGIGVDPRDGLLVQGAEGYQLTWMDAKVDDWVVTPRRGKAVEINALWYNALRCLDGWAREERDDRGANLAAAAERARQAFNERFWYEDGRYLYDVIDGEQGNDPACRPNQILAIALDFPVLERSRWEAVLEVVRRRLLTPFGLRSLAPGHPDYKAKYYGDLRSRDAAYHQGTVWAWLIGSYIDAWLKVYPDDRREARALLDGFDRHLSEACVGSISEIFDAERPYIARGCIAQAWSVAEVLRSLMKTRAVIDD